MKTVAVFFGGRSNEHEISIITGTYAVNLLRGAGYKVVPVYLPLAGGMRYAITTGINAFEKESAKFAPVYVYQGALYLEKRHKKLFTIDVALNCCHGGAGENGTLSALLQWNNVPFASPPAVISGVFMDKRLSKIAARGLDIPVVAGTCVREGEEIDEVAFPVIVKPAALGSSIGIKVAKNKEELTRALELAFTLDSAAVVEEYLPNKRDINCAAYRKNGEVIASPCEEVFSSDDILSFREKYEAPSRQNKLPAELSEQTAALIREYTKRIYESFDCVGVVRADFLVSGDKVYFNELNTVPGSLAAYLFGKSLTDARGFLSSLVEEAAREKQKQIVTTGILSSGVFAGVKGSKRARQ